MKIRARQRRAKSVLGAGTEWFSSPAGPGWHEGQFEGIQRAHSPLLAAGL